MPIAKIFRQNGVFKPPLTSDRTIRFVVCLLKGFLVVVYVCRFMQVPRGAVAQKIYLDNGEIRIGVDISLGGSITYLATFVDGQNIINNHDYD
ncbi:MAG: hypothetical protein JXM70_27005 [Pirellulales bacterium]|nr:hypothetical protein [Pirellulales bacterium]